MSQNSHLPVFLSGYQLVFFRMLDDAEGKIHIEASPIEMLVVQQLNVADLPYGCVPEPWKLLKGQEVFLARKKEPKTVLGNARDFRPQSVFATL